MRWLLFLLLLSCSTAPKETRNLRISFNTQPATLDPRKAGDFVSSTLVCMLYEGLTRCLPAGSVEPALAERVEISSDETIYTFHLRRAYWSDGKPITAYDFETSWKQILDPSSLCAYLLYPIKNAERYVKKEISIDAVGIKALDERTLRVELERPAPYFYSLTAFPTFLPFPSHTPDPTICSGPFRLKERLNQSELVLEKNPTYWNCPEVFLDEIHISIVPDEMTALHMFERGELDWLGGTLSPLPLEGLEKFKEQLTFIPSAATTFCTFNTQTFPFNNLHLRKAFSYAIDRDEIVKQVTQMGQIAATSILPPVFSSQNYPLSDPVKAREHLELALLELNISPQELETLVLYYKPSQVEKRLAQTLQRQWEERLGITVQLIQLDYKSHAHRLQNRDYQLSLATWIAQFSDPISILERFKDQANLKNYPGWEDPLYAELLNGRSLLRAEDLLADQAPLTPIYHWSPPALCSPRVQATGTSPCGGILFERFRLSQR